MTTYVLDTNACIALIHGNEANVCLADFGAR